jgi:alpha-D-xyloside xylohydrolase
LCGFPFWSVDIGGFGGTPTPDLYMRWAQAGLFVSHPRAHGPIHREPWAFGERAVEIFRKYAKLRYRLMPYVWSTAQRSVQTCLPVQRPLLLDWQDDPTVAGIDDQWLFGEALMVAPILDEGTRRKVYLPQGVWHDYWTDAIFNHEAGGRWITVDAPLDHLPLYVRGGAIIPTCADAPHTGAQDWSRLTLSVYTGDDGAFELCDGDERIAYRVTPTLDGLRLHIGAGARQYRVRVIGVGAVRALSVDGQPFESWAVEDNALAFDLAGGAQAQEIVLRR